MGSCSCSKPIPKIPPSPKGVTPININISYKMSNNNTHTNNIKDLKNKYNNIKTKNVFFYEDLEEQESYIKNYKSFISELFYQINDLKDHLNISICEEKYYENLLNKEENNELINDIEIISNKIKEFNVLLDSQKAELKNLENKFQIIQDIFNIINPYEQDIMYLINIDSIKEHLTLSEKIIKNLKYNKTLYEQKKAEIESDIASIQFITEEKVTTIKKKGKEDLKNIYLKKYNNDNYDLINDFVLYEGQCSLA